MNLGFGVVNDFTRRFLVMMHWIVGSSLQRRFLIVALAVAMMVFGLTRLNSFPVDVLPEFTPPYVEVQTEALGLSAEEVEQLITVPLEADLLNGVAWLDTISSESIPGLSTITLTFEPGTDFLRARQVVQEKLTQAHALPNVSKAPAMVEPLSSTSRFMMVGLSSEELSLIEMSVIARWTMRPRLTGVQGVANVAIWGQRKRQLQVQVEPERLQAEGVTLSQIIETAGDALWISPLSFLNASLPGTGGFIDTPNQRLGIRHVLPIESSNELAKVPLAGGEGEVRLLGDVTEVIENHQPLIGDAFIDGEPSLMLVIEKFPWANTLQVTRNVEEALDALRPGLSGIEIDTKIFRPASFIETSVNNFAHTLIIVGILVLLALFILLLNWRTTLISVLVIPISVMAAVLVLYSRGITINTMIIAGIAIALVAVIDDAIVSIQSMARRLRQQRDEDKDKSMARIIIEASLEVRNPMIFATLIGIMALLPIFFIEGVLGSLLQPVAFAYVLAVLASMVVALTVTPALGFIFLTKTSREGDEFVEKSNAGPKPALLQGIQAIYNPILSGFVRAPVVAYLITAIVLAVGVLGLYTLWQPSFIPSFQQKQFLVDWESAPGTSHPEMGRIVNQAAGELRSIEGVRNVNAHIGRAVLSDEVVNVNSSQLWVSLKQNANYQETMAEVREVVEGYPGLSHSVLTYPEKRVNDISEEVESDIVVRVYGYDLDILREEAEKLTEAFTDVAGVTDSQVENTVTEPIIEVEVDLAKAEGHGLKPGDVRRTAAVLLSGLEVGSLFENQKVFDVVVWSTPETRQSVTDVRDLLMETATGEYVTLEEVANVNVVSAPNVIKHEGVLRYLDIGTNVADRNLNDVASEMKALILESQFPLEYYAELLGGRIDQNAAQWRLWVFTGIAILGILLLLQAAFSSWSLAILAFVSLPAALVGGVITASLTGGLITLGSLVGFMALLGLTARHAILMISRLQKSQKAGESVDRDLVLESARENFIPIFLTAIITALFLAPFVYFGGIPGHEILQPMAVVVLGGLVTSTLMSLLVIPALYMHFGANSKPDIWSPQYG